MHVHTHTEVYTNTYIMNRMITVLSILYCQSKESELRRSNCSILLIKYIYNLMMSACRYIVFPDVRKVVVNLDVFYWMLSEFHDDCQLTRKKNQRYKLPLRICK